jgi:UDP-GlcNAc:undecaprenyl-phosphate GlcNAc-1-phosphate transferase
MTTLLTVGICSALVSLLLTPLFRDFFAFLEMVDQPDSRRKLHVRPVPRVGGIPIALSYICALAGALLGASFWKEMLSESGPTIHLLGRLMPALVIIFLTGLLDDFRGLTPLQKVAGQVLAASCALWAGVRLAPIQGYPHLDNWVGLLSILWLVFCANAFNLIDGLDGLASGVALLAATGLLLAALIHHHPTLALATVPLVGGLIGFLYYNVNPASVFLGDCGSLLIGFLIGCFGLLWNQHAASGLGRYAPVMALAVPASEVAVSIMRRFLRQQPIFDPDHNHIHHRLLSLGLTQRNAAFVLYGVTALGATLAVLQTIVHPRAATVVTVLFAAGTYLGVRRLRYTEFGAVRQLLLGGELRRMLRMQICLEEYQESLAAASTVEECWKAVCEASSAAGFRYVALQLDGNHFETANEVTEENHSPRISIPLLAGSGQMLFVQASRALGSAMWIAPIVEVLEERLQVQRLLSQSDKPRKRPEALTAVAR